MLRETLIHPCACVGVRIFSEARRAAPRRSHSSVKQRNAAVGENAAQVEDPGRFWPLAASRYRSVSPPTNQHRALPADQNRSRAQTEE